MTLQEDFCSYEVAKLLKEKGFNFGLAAKYADDGEAPTCTTALAMKWLREKGIEICISPLWCKSGKQYKGEILKDMGTFYDCPQILEENTYETAVESALLFTLKNLI